MCDESCLSGAAVRELSGRGRGIVTTKAVPANTVACCAEPELTALYSDHVKTHCGVCFKRGLRRLKLCRGCELFSFCEKGPCGRSELARKVHPIECKWASALPNSTREGDTDYVRFVLRYCALKKLGHPSVARLDSLCSNYEIQSEEFTSWARSFALLFLSQFGSELGATMDDLIRLLSIVRTNSLGFPFNSDVTLGWCLQTTVSMLNHSCTPNCGITAAGPEKCKMEVRTLRPVGVGEELTISYLDLQDPGNVSVAERRKALFERYRFECDCPRCVSESAAVNDKKDKETKGSGAALGGGGATESAM